MFNISLKLFKASLVNRLQVQGGANIPNTSSFTSAGDHYYKLMEPYFIAKKYIHNYPKAFPCVNQL